MSMRETHKLKKTAIFVTLVEDKGNEGSGNDIEKIATHSRPQTHYIFFVTSVMSVKPRENEFEK